MTIREILIYPNPSLKEIAKPVVEFNEVLKELAMDMLETMYTFDGVGLAGPQIGVPLRIFVMDIVDGLTSDENGNVDPKVWINPEIVQTSEEVHLIEEGCLSFPGYLEKVSRHQWIKATAQDLDGNPMEVELTGLAAQCFEHETEHLDGHVLVDNISRSKRRFITSDLKKRKSRKNLRYAIPNT